MWRKVSVKAVVVAAVVEAASLGAFAVAGAPTDYFGEREQVWSVLTNRFYCPKTEALYDVLWRDGAGGVSATGCLPTPEEIRRQYPNPCAWGTGMQDCVFNGAPFLTAAVKRGDLAMAKAAYRGILRCATVSGVRGFVARSVSPADGRSFYIDSSRDTWTLFVYHLRAYSREACCDAATRGEIRDLLVGVADYAERSVTATNDYSLLRADGKPGLVSRMWLPLQTHETLRLPMIYAAAFDMTGDRHWREMKLRYLDRALDGAEGPIGDDIRGSILNQMQLSVRILWETEDDPARKARLLRLLNRLADIAAGPLTGRLGKAFGTPEWKFAGPMEDWRHFPWRKRWSCDSAVFHGYRYDVPDTAVATVEDSYVESAYAVLVQALAPGRPVDSRTLGLFRRAIGATDLSAVACANAVNALLAMEVVGRIPSLRGVRHDEAGRSRARSGP